MKSIFKILLLLFSVTMFAQTGPVTNVNGKVIYNYQPASTTNTKHLTVNPTTKELEFRVVQDPSISNIPGLQDSISKKLNTTFFEESDFSKSYIAPYSAGNIRNSEADILVKSDGRYLCVYSKFDSDSRDDAPSKITAKISTDNTGTSWGNEFLVSPNIGAKNVLSVSLLRINSTTIHCYFLRGNGPTDLALYKCISTDDGLTWGTATSVINEGYTDVLNASIKRVNSNRIIIPIEYVADATAPILTWNQACYYSDNNGSSYTKSNVVNVPNADGETSIVSLGGNNLLFSTRTTTGYQWFTKSTNNGQTLGIPYQSTLKSVAAPAQIVNYSGTLIALHNPNTVDDRRNPLTISKSLDLGVTWTKIIDLESANTFTSGYAYPSLTLDGDDLLISYFELPNLIGGIGLKFSKINLPNLLNGIVPKTQGTDNIYLTGLTINTGESINPSDNVNEAIAKLQAQINNLKGNVYRYEGTGIAQEFKNNDPSNLLQGLYSNWRNTDGTSTANIGYVSSNQNFYIYATTPLRLSSDNIIHDGTSVFNGNGIFNNKLAVGTNNPLQQFVVSRGGNEGLEIAVDDPTNKTISILGYDRTANVYRPINFSAASFSFDKEVSVQTAIAGTSAVPLTQLNSYLALKENINTYSAKTANYTIIPADYTIDFTSGNNTATLPSAASNINKKYIIKNGTGKTTIATVSSQTIDGASGLVLFNLNSTVLIQSDGANWKILDSYNTTSVIDSALTITQTAATLNSAYPNATAPFVIYAPNVGTGMVYIKTTTGGQWMMYSGALLNP